MVRNLTVEPVDRAVDRKGKYALSSCQRANYFGAINTPPFELVFNKFSKSKILILSSILLQVFERVLEPKD